MTVKFPFLNMNTGLTERTELKRAVINASNSGDNELVAGVTGKQIVVISFVLVLSADTNIRFDSNASGTALTGVMELAANSGLSPGEILTGHFETLEGESLSLNLSAGNNADGYLTYVEV